MQITMTPRIGMELKAALDAAGKTAARFIVTGFGCMGPLFDIELSDMTDNDVTFDVTGILFVIEKDLAIGLKKPVIVKTASGFSVKRTSCGC